MPEKGGMIVIENVKNELIPTGTITGWLICMDYKNLKKAAKKDHFCLPFIDQILNSLFSISTFWMDTVGTTKLL